MNRRLLVALLCLFTATPLSAQSFARDGWEAFPLVEYQGGDSTHPKKRSGVLVLTDTTLSLRKCLTYACRDWDKAAPPFEEAGSFTIQLADITGVDTGSQVRGPGIGARVMFGVLATGSSNDFVNVVYKTPSDVQAPIFKTARTQAAALVAKIRFRVEKAGVVLAER